MKSTILALGVALATLGLVGRASAEQRGHRGGDHGGHQQRDYHEGHGGHYQGHYERHDYGYAGHDFYRGYPTYPYVAPVYQPVYPAYPYVTPYGYGQQYGSTYGQPGVSLQFSIGR